VGGKSQRAVARIREKSVFPRYVENLLLLGYDESLLFIGSKGKILP
jgi:hypothetical protein